MNTKILASLVLIGIAISGITMGTVAYFSDVETSTGNTFTAGKLDLLVDSKCSYNGVSQLFCTWSSKDLVTGDWFFKFLDVKPGDYGEDTVSLHVVDNPSCGFVKITKITDSDVSCNEPELAAEPLCTAAGDGELDENLVIKIYKDLDCDNVIDEGDTELIGIVDGEKYWALGDLSTDPALKTCIQIHWNLPSSVGNIVQSDSFTADVIFYAEQKRSQFATCPVGLVRVESGDLIFGSNGWAGWSCPAGKIVVGGGTTCTLPLAISKAAKPGDSQYPVYPHYTYTPPETGWVVQNGGTGQTCKIYAICA
jgi:predicted ribosomally synthesized peptide with SipW-like signal peptide